MRRGKYLLNGAIDWKKSLLGGVDLSDTKTIVIPHAKTIYVPIPKAANSSVKRALYPTLGFEPDPRVDVHRDRRIPLVPLSQALAGAKEDWFIFAIVRDPSQRSLSAWKDKVVRREVKNQASLRRMGIEPGDSHETLLRAIKYWPEKLLNDHFMPQSLLLSRAMAHDRLEIFKFETLDEGWPRICQRIVALGGAQPSLLPHLNAGRPSRTDKFSPDEAELIDAVYRADFRHFGYARLSGRVP